MGKVNKKSDQGCQGKANRIEGQLYLGEFTGTVSCLLPASSITSKFFGLMMKQPIQVIYFLKYLEN